MTQGTTLTVGISAGIVAALIFLLSPTRETEPTFPSGVDRTPIEDEVGIGFSSTDELVDATLRTTRRVDREFATPNRTDALGATDDLTASADELEAENARLQAQIDELEALRAQEAQHGALLATLVPQQDRAADSPFGRWRAGLIESEVPAEEELNMIAGYLAEWPVEISTAEGLWIAERTRLDDWLTYGPTADEAIIIHLGASRVMKAVEASSPERARFLREAYADEGYFD